MVLGLATFWQVFWRMVIATFFILWIWMFITCFVDVFRRRDVSGFGKAVWAIFMIVFPFLGVLIYMIARPDTAEA